MDFSGELASNFPGHWRIGQIGKDRPLASTRDPRGHGHYYQLENSHNHRDSKLILLPRKLDLSAFGDNRDGLQDR